MSHTLATVVLALPLPLFGAAAISMVDSPPAAPTPQAL